MEMSGEKERGDYGGGTRTMAGLPEWRRIPESALRGPRISRADAVLLDLRVQGLVVRLEQTGRLALVAAGDLDGPPDRPPLRLGPAPVARFSGRDGGRLGAGAIRRLRLPGAFVEARQVLGRDDVRAQEGRPADDVPELPDISRPRVPHEEIGGVRCPPA